MNKSEFSEVIKAPAEKVWQVLFKQYGDIHIHNPGMISSAYLNEASEGPLGCVRHCQFNEKLSLDEKITEVDDLKRVKIDVTKHNLPFIKSMSATYELSAVKTASGEAVTEVKMTSYVSFSPGFMKYLMRGQLGKGLVQHLFGMKYFIETGNTVGADNYAQVVKSYR